MSKGEISGSKHIVNIFNRFLALMKSIKNFPGQIMHQSWLTYVVRCTMLIIGAVALVWFASDTKIDGKCEVKSSFPICFSTDFLRLFIFQQQHCMSSPPAHVIKKK